MRAQDGRQPDAGAAGTKTEQGQARRAPVEREVDALVVGAGFAGLYAVQRLREQGFSVLGVEAGQDVGGTWYWNRYPGARCDVPSLNYAYTWSDEVRRAWRWSEKYATQPEILRYIQFVAERYDLRSAYLFGTRVQSAVFDEESARWTVTTDRGDRIRARYCLLATGNLSVPNLPQVEGAQDFAGRVYHTGRWPHEPVDFRGLRVGLIGTGSSGVQAAPLLAAAAKELLVFQRTPNFSVPAHNGPLTEEDHQAFERQLPEFRKSLDSFGRVPASAFTAPVPSKEAQWQRYGDLWDHGGSSFLYAFPNILTHQEVNDGAAAFVKEKIRGIVKDPETAEALCATRSPFGVKRVCVDTDYFATFNRPNVRLVNLRKEPLERLTPRGVQTARAEYALDAVVFATGFDAMTGAILAMQIQGRGGRTMREAWAEGPQSYLGLMVSGFPNLFTITGPGSPSVIGNVLLHGEHHVEYVLDLLRHAQAAGRPTIEAEAAAQHEWGRHVASVAERTLFPQANSWYLGSNIPCNPRVFMPYVGEGYRKTCAEIAADGYRGFQFAPARP